MIQCRSVTSVSVAGSLGVPGGDLFTRSNELKPLTKLLLTGSFR